MCSYAGVRTFGFAMDFVHFELKLDHQKLDHQKGYKCDVKKNGSQCKKNS